MSYHLWLDGKSLYPFLHMGKKKEKFRSLKATVRYGGGSIMSHWFLASGGTDVPHKMHGIEEKENYVEPVS